MEYTIFKDLENSFPQILQTTIGENTYYLLFKRNERFDFYTLSIIKQDQNDKEEVLFTTKILYFTPILQSKINDDLDPAKIQLYFLDEKELQVDTPNKFHTKVDSSNFLQDVFLVFFNVTSI